MILLPEIYDRIRIDVSKTNTLAPLLTCKQGDIRSRYLNVTIKSFNEAVKVPQEAKVTINARRPDNAAKAYWGEVNQDGTVTVPINSWMLEVDGILHCDISFLGADGSRLTTCGFNIRVERAVYSAGDVSEAPDSKDIYTELLERVIEIELEIGEKMPNYAIGEGLAVTDDTLCVTLDSDVLIATGEEITEMLSEVFAG